MDIQPSGREDRHSKTEIEDSEGRAAAIISEALSSGRVVAFDAWPHGRRTKEISVPEEFGDLSSCGRRKDPERESLGGGARTAGNGA